MKSTHHKAAPAGAAALAALLAPGQYQAERGNVFPSAQSLRWFMRRNRVDLIERGAIVCPTGSMLIDADKFDQAVLAIGRRRVGGAE